MTDRLKLKQTELAALKAKLAEPEAIALDREEARKRLAEVPPWSEAESVQVKRQTLRKLGIERIVVTPDETG